MRNDISPGLSDIDLLYIFDKEIDIEKHLRRVQKYLFLTPLIVEVEYMDQDVFNNWMAGDELRSLEFRANKNEERGALNIASESAFFFSSVKEVFNLYLYLLEGTLASNATFRKHIVMKHVIDIYRVIYFHQARDERYLTMSRDDLFNKKIKREKDKNFLSLVDQYEPYLSTLFCEIKLFCKLFLSFIEKRYPVQLNLDKFSCLCDTDIFGKKVIFCNIWGPHEENQIPLSEEMFKALRASSLVEHDIINFIIKKFNDSNLEQLHLQRIYADMMGPWLQHGQDG